jgi:hypothetical protein
MLVGICTHKAQAQDNKDFIQDALELTTVKAGIAKDSACFRFLSAHKDSNGAAIPYVLKLRYNTPTNGKLTKTDIQSIKAFPEGAKGEKGGFEGNFSGAKTEDDIMYLINMTKQATTWVTGKKPEEVYVVNCQNGCPVFK